MKANATPVHWTVGDTQEKVEIMQILLDHGGDPNRKTTVSTLS
jgi:hypothetical protein